MSSPGASFGSSNDNNSDTIPTSHTTPEFEASPANSDRSADKAKNSDEKEEGEVGVIAEVLETYTELAQCRVPSLATDKIASDLQWKVSSDEYARLQRILESRDPRYLVAASWALDHARQEYDPDQQLLRLRMPTRLHEETANVVVDEILQILRPHVPGGQTFVPKGCATEKLYVNGKRYDQCPDQSIGIRAVDPPTFMLEVKFSHELLDEKALRYLEGSEGRICSVLYLKTAYRDPAQRSRDIDEPMPLTASFFHLRPATSTSDEQDDEEGLEPTAQFANVIIPTRLADCHDHLTLAVKDLTDIDTPANISIPHATLRTALDAAVRAQAQADGDHPARPAKKLKRRRDDGDVQEDGKQETGQDSPAPRKKRRARSGKDVEKRTSLPAREGSGSVRVDGDAGE